MDRSSGAETFRSLLLRLRGRTGLIQRDLATRVGVSRGSVQDWEAGVSYPTAERLQALIRVLLEAGALTAGKEASEAHALWAAVERESEALAGRGRVLVRPSGTEPLVRVMVEAPREDECEEVVSRLANLVRTELG